MKKLQVGIIGLGGIARSHCDAIETLDNVEIVAVADLFGEKRRQYMDKYNIPKGYGSHTELLQDDEIDAVAVVLGHQLHHQLTVDACNAGKHVLVEKPMAISLEQCDNMIAAAAANHVKLMVAYTQHFYGTSVKAKEILVALDACFSGAGGRSVLAKGARPLITKVDLGKTSSRKITVLTAASANQITTTLEDQRHGMFTYFLLKGLNSGRTVTAKSLYRFLKPKVQDEARLQNREQTPTLHSTSNFVIR